MLGLPDKDYGEAVTAIIVAEAGAKRKRDDESKPVMTLEELCGWAKDKLAPYEVILTRRNTNIVCEIIHHHADNILCLFSAANTFANMGELTPQRHGKGNKRGFLLKVIVWCKNRFSYSSNVV